MNKHLSVATQMILAAAPFNVCSALYGVLFAGSNEADDTEGQQRQNPLKKGYHCQTCDKTLQLTATEILRHRKAHAESGSSGSK